MLPRETAPLPRVAFWLVPDAPARDTLQAVIRRLADDYAAPVFVPHVTLCSCQRTPQGQELAVLARLAATCPLSTMQVTGCAGDDVLTRALYLDLEPDTVAAELHARLCGQLSPRGAKDWRPHLSLLYQALPPPERDALVTQQSIPVGALRLTELWAVAIPERLSCRDDLLGWRPLLRCRLAAAPGADMIDSGW